MSPRSGFTAVETLPSAGQVHVVGAGPVIKHNKDLFESIDDPFALLDKLHIY